jgi:hypothetical protein
MSSILRKPAAIQLKNVLHPDAAGFQQMVFGLLVTGLVGSMSRLQVAGIIADRL